MQCKRQKAMQKSYISWSTKNKILIRVGSESIASAALK